MGKRRPGEGEGEGGRGRGLRDRDRESWKDREKRGEIKRERDKLERQEEGQMG